MNSEIIIGFDADETPIVAYVNDGLYDYAAKRIRVLLVGQSSLSLTDWLGSQTSGLADAYSFSALLNFNSEIIYPPSGEAYISEAHYIWRWIGVCAPDIVIIQQEREHQNDLATQLRAGCAAGFGSIPAVSVAQLTQGSVVDTLYKSTRSLSNAHLEVLRRLERTPREIAQMLSARYANTFDQAVYIPAIALIGRIKLGELTAVENIVAPFRKDAKHALANLTSSHFAGHLIFGVLAQETNNQKYIDLVCAAANLAFDNDQVPREAMPLHDEMSDSIFLVCPLLAQAGFFTGDIKFVDMCFRHLKYIQKLTLREDGLYRHSPLCETAWGRGNGFVVLGLLYSLEYLPSGHKDYPAVLAHFQAFMEILVSLQQIDGMWRQVIDLPGSYAELSATCMISTALAHGLRKGWLHNDSSRYYDALTNAWQAIRIRISLDGELVNVCAGTGKQPNLKAYLERPAVIGPDLRGGAMAMLIATELMQEDEDVMIN